MSRRTALLAFLLLGAVVRPPLALAAVVYDNTTTYQSTENELLPAGQIASGEHGNQVQLTGTERFVSSLTYKLRIAGAGAASFNIRIRFYANDGVDGRPGTVLWESPVLTRVIDSGAPLTYTQPIPSVLVPDTFTWTVQVSNRQGNMARMGPSEYHPPTVGSATPGFWQRIGNDWQLIGLEEPPFGARVSADAIATAIDDGASPALLPDRLTVAPNPVSGRATFQLFAPASAREPEQPLAIEIFDPAGRLVAKLPLRSLAAEWTPQPGLQRGVYLARVISAGREAATKFILLD
ncbi:MAG TPA: T9SS type A sorting domain-containing protein [Candidatus Udaeobacter sp.]|nr:T9SS type A sorting domain-containing protein [Candidatus Udaeobacter sp.]